ncbi:MAG: Veg family protein [Bacilli bacterium]|jgi:uncharacterized protein Veg
MVTIKNVKEELNKHLGDEVTIKYNLGRNKYEKYNVKLKKLYDYVFTVELEKKKSKEIKSFSYSDVITKIIKIDY